MVRSIHLLAAIAAAALSACSTAPPPVATPAATTPESPPPSRPAEPIDNPTARALVGLFGVASETITGRLKVVQEHNEDQLTVTIGDAWVHVGGDGLELPQDDVQRLRSLAGCVVTAGINRRTIWAGHEKARVLMGDGERLCLAREEEMRGLVAMRKRLEENRLWRADALVMETGTWEHFLARLPTEKRAFITSDVKELLRGDGPALAGDIISWLTRTAGTEFDPLPTLLLEQRGLSGPWHLKDVRVLATIVIEASLGLSPRTLIREDWKGLDACRRLWILSKLLRSVGPP